MKAALFFLAMALLTGTVTAQTVIQVPYGKTSVLIDGKYDAQEWKDGYRLMLTDSLNLWIKQDSANIYWCLQGLYQPAVLGGVNFYITQNNRLLNLHASAKLGERQLAAGNYGEWVWWNNKEWAANVARPDKIEERKFLRDEAKEFQLRKTRFGDKTMRMMLDIEFPRQLLPCYPVQADTANANQWVALQF